MNKKLHKCFKKVRVKKETTRNEIQKLIKQRIELKKSAKTIQSQIDKTNIETKIDDVELKIAHATASKSSETIKQQFSDMSNLQGSFSNIGMWKLKQKLIPRPSDAPMVKKDPAGNLVTNPELLKNLCLLYTSPSPRD